MMGSERNLLLVLLIVQFAGYGYGLRCHTCEANRWDLKSPCLNDTLLHEKKCNSVECTISNAINYDQLKHGTWDVENLRLGCGKVEYRISTGLLWIQRGCYIQVMTAKSPQGWIEYFSRRNDLENSISVCNSGDFCNAAPTPTFGVIAKAFSILLGMIVSFVL